MTATTLQNAIQQTIAANPAFVGAAQPVVVKIGAPGGTLHPSDSSSSNTGLIVGLTVGLGGGLLLALVVALFVFKSQKQQGPQIPQKQQAPVAQPQVQHTTTTVTTPPISGSTARACC